MTENTFLACIIATVVGLLLVIYSAKKAQPTKEYPAAMQWGALLVLVGIFGVLSNFMSFTAVMLIFVLISGCVTALDHWLLAPLRQRAHVAQLVRQTVTQEETAGVLASEREQSLATTKAKAAESVISVKPGFWIENARSFFPVLLVVFLLRAFLVEPFTIPSSSMRPGLVVGDFILVNKFIYGIRLPLINNVLVPVSSVQRGDVVVFSYPPDPKINYIKRVIGLPGDRVEYRNKQLTINGQRVIDDEDGHYQYVEQGYATITAERFTESLPNRRYEILKIAQAPTISLAQVTDFPYRDRCQYDEAGFVCTVPNGEYFMLGDNRDNSLDSRYWGFVEDRLLVGKAFMIWLNFSDLSRIGKKIQ